MARFRLMSIATLSLCMAMSSQVTLAADSNGKLITSYKDSKTIDVGLADMDHVLNAPSDGCTQITGRVTVKGVQFSESGRTLQSFWFIDKDGTRWVVPTNIDKMRPSVDAIRASDFIRVGKKYFLHIQVCGSGGFASLISMYLIDNKFGFNTK